MSDWHRVKVSLRVKTASVTLIDGKQYAFDDSTAGGVLVHRDLDYELSPGEEYRTCWYIEDFLDSETYGVRPSDGLRAAIRDPAMFKRVVPAVFASKRRRIKHV
jgi:hypothetical protein